jgi:5-methylcytosine-specific restriction endonuclease McrA
MNFSKKHDSFSVKKILNLNKTGKLNLNPGFQRASVWSNNDKKALIDTILKGLPLPNVFLWEHKEGNKKIYDVIDGKQRIESLLEFTRFRLPMSVKFDPDRDQDWNWPEPYEWTWKELQKEERKIASRFLSYTLPVVIVRGSLPDVEQVFIRINSTGKKLSPQEIRHAKWYKNSNLLLAAESIAKARKYERYFTEMGILSASQITRMKAIELVTELILSVEREDVLDRKKSLDSVMGNQGINKATITRISKEVKSILDQIQRTFPELPTSRFRKTSDFYALFLAVWQMKRDGFDLTNKTKAKMAFEILNQLDNDLIMYRQSFKSGRRSVLRSPAREYHNTVLEGTDTARKRRARVRIIENILRPIFNQKDPRRLFTQEQKQLLWHSSKDKCCSNRQCRKPLSWNDVRMDHIKAHTKGGRTNLRNAQILCASCNSKKGGK